MPLHDPTIYEMLINHCGLDALQDLLRTYKPADKELRVTAENKSVIVNRNIRSGVERGIIPLQRLYALLQASEENGAQRIFLYVLRNQRLSSYYRQGDAVAEKRFGRGQLAGHKFPRLLDAPSDDPTWADFRIGERTWVAKFYWREVTYETIEDAVPDGIDPADGMPIFKKRYKRAIYRAVLLMRWNGKGILEVRVPLCASRKAVTEMERQVWTQMQPAIDKAHFREFSLVTACTRMIREEHQHEHLYDLSDTLLRDSDGGTYLISTSGTEDNDGAQTRLFAVHERKEAVDAILSHRQNQSERLVVTFKPTPQNNAVTSKLRVIVAAYDFHEIVIGSKVTPEAVDHVIYRLQELA